MNYSSAPGAFGSDDFRDRTARETLDGGIEGGEAGGEDFPGLGSPERIGAESERGSASGVRVHAISPFVRLPEYCGAEAGGSQWQGGGLGSF